MLPHSRCNLELAASQDNQPLPPVQVPERAFLLTSHHFSDWSLHQLIRCSWPHPPSPPSWKLVLLRLFFFWVWCNSAVRWGCLWAPKEINVIFKSVFLAFGFISGKGFWHIYTKQSPWKSRNYLKMQIHFSNRLVKKKNTHCDAIVPFLMSAS